MFEESELQQLRQVIREVVREELRAALEARQAEPELVTTTQAGAISSVSERTIMAWVRKGRLRRYGGESRVVLVNKAELLAFLSTDAARPDGSLSPDEWVARRLEAKRAKERAKTAGTTKPNRGKS